MANEPLNVYPVAAENDEELDIPEFRTDDDSVVVKIDNIEEEKESNEQMNSNPSSSERPKSGFTSVVTAIRVAKWLAKASGYATQKKLLYAPQDTVIRSKEKDYWIKILPHNSFQSFSSSNNSSDRSFSGKST